MYEVYVRLKRNKKIKINGLQIHVKMRSVIKLYMLNLKYQQQRLEESLVILGAKENLLKDLSSLNIRRSSMVL